ncbi:MAG: cobaltochelatase subunit CobN, partial [Leptolyngbya sp. DLM2.Bin15]
MHRIAATPGGWNPGMEGVMFVEQTPAPIIILTAADTEILAIAQAIAHLPDGFPSLRVAHILHLQQQLSIDTYADTVLRHAQVIVVRLLGGQAYWPYGLDVVRETVEQTGARLLVLPGDDRPDLGLMHQSTVPLAIANQLWRYFTEGGIDNMVQALQYLAQVGLDRPYHPLPPRPVPKVDCYPWAEPSSATGRVGLLFYRAHYLSGNMAVIDGLCEAIARRGMEPMPMFVSSLRDMEVQTAIRQQWQRQPVDLVLNTTGFSLARLEAAEMDLDLWRSLDVPVLQVILSSGTREQWDSEWRGLLPRDVAMNVALPEVDGRIITRAVSFKARQDRHPQIETDVVRYEPMPDRLEFVADLAANWVRLRNTPRGDRRLALILANYPSRDGRLANGVGLDTPESVVQILHTLATAGYDVQPLPASGKELMQWLTQGVTHDPDGWDLRPVRQSLSRSVYLDYWQTLPPEVQKGVGDRWSSPETLPAEIPIPGLQLGSVFIGIQPPRGYDLDPSLNYHAADLEPPHAYLAFYHWLRHDFGAQALVHVGKHGNLEWLPGKSVALSQTCYPEVASGALPHLYPFIVNDPGEGSQAKRRSQAVIIDHLTPPLTRAELYGPLQQLERLIDEYYEADSLDPSRLPVIRDRIQTLIQATHLNQDLSTLPGSPATEFNDLLTRTDGYLCELKEAQIRDGLHILGQCPSGRLLRDLIIAIARSPDRHRLGLTRAIAAAWELDCDPLSDDPATCLSESDRHRLAQQQYPYLRTVGDAVEQIEQTAAQQVDAILAGQPPSMTQAAIAPELTWIQTDLLPKLHNTHQELTALLHGLDGGYIPSGPSGAPTRGRADVLPTGRNFYSVDIRGIPTESAWAVGRNAAELLIERYTQEEGNYPRSLALSVWGTSTMRTGGDDLAEALALLGVQPVWDGPSRRVVDFEILPLEVLGRSRVDVTLRISGFFRD